MHLTIPMISTILALSALAVGLISLLIGCLALVKSLAIERSTHNIEYVPIDPAIDQYNEELIKKEKVPVKDPWATSEETIRKQREMYSEELEDSMPDFALSDEDKEIISF